MLHEYEDVRPTLGEGVFVAPGAHVIGDVEIGDHSSIWFNTVVRGDVDYIRIGHRTNIQDGSICHGMLDECPVILGDFVTVGHGGILHGCTVESHCLIGMGATIMNNVRVGAGSIVAARALLTENTEIPPGSLVLGAPGRVQRALTEEEIAGIDEYARRYCRYKDAYLAGPDKR